MDTEELQRCSSSSTFQSTRWWSNETVAVVTGANKGIGFAIVKRFAALGLNVILTARDKERGEKAVDLLAAQGLHVTFFRLDISDPASIKAFVRWFGEKFGVLDVLVNNAAVSFNDIHENSVEHAETVMNTNFYGTKLLTATLLPWFRRSSSMSRILNISSRLGLLSKVRNPRIKEVLEGKGNLTEERIEGVVSLFLESVKNGTWEKQGWPKIWTDYSVSKLALNAHSKVLAKRHEGRGLSVNCFCPGFTQTAMTGGRGTHTADSVADTAIRLALLPPQEIPTGKFFLAYNPLVSSKL